MTEEFDGVRYWSSDDKRQYLAARLKRDVKEFADWTEVELDAEIAKVPTFTDCRPLYFGTKDHYTDDGDII